MPNYRLLNNINYPSDLKKLNVEELKELAVELRTELIDVVSETASISSVLNSTANSLSSSKFSFFKSDG